MRLLTWKSQHRLAITSHDEAPRYAILSHTWGRESDELKLTDVQNGRGKSKAGYKKIQYCGKQAEAEGLEYFWVDTCCIDKQSSAELSEAINSMYRWYQEAEVCYVYLSDVSYDDWPSSLRNSKWFTRGWTLQELLAPRSIVFYDCNWQHIGDRVSLAATISDATGIAVNTLKTRNLDGHSIAQKMAWAAKRITTRVEDRAYCLMGLFGVNMPLLYGEGDRAFVRLQEEILKYQDDHSIFAWSMDKRVKFSGLLAPHPDCFVGSQRVVQYIPNESEAPFAMTNRGLSIRLEITPWSADTYLAYLNCAREEHANSRKRPVRMGIFLRRLRDDDQYVRVKDDLDGLWLNTDEMRLWEDRPTRHRLLFIRQIPEFQRYGEYLRDRIYGFELSVNCLLSSSWVPAYQFSSDSRIAKVSPSHWGYVIVIDASAKDNGLRRIALGFDFEFSPVCIIEESSSTTSSEESARDNLCDWWPILNNEVVWDETIEGGGICHKKMLNGQWALKGHRVNGLSVLLGESINDKGWLVTLKREETRQHLVWKFNIDSLIGPFRNHNHELLQSQYRGREGFQQWWGLTMSEADLRSGDDILLQNFSPAILSDVHQPKD